MKEPHGGGLHTDELSGSEASRLSIVMRQTLLSMTYEQSAVSSTKGLYISSWLTIVLGRKEGKQLASYNINLLFNYSLTYELEVAINLKDIIGNNNF